MAGAPHASLEGFDAFLDQNPQQNPQLVADAVTRVLNMAPGTRPTRTEVDTVGMGDAIKGLNATQDAVMTGVFTAFGREGMLTLNTGDAQAA